MESAPSNRPKIAYVVHSLNLGGTEQLVVRMSKILNKDFEIAVLCLDEPGLWAPELRKAGIPVYCLWRQPGLDIRAAIKMARFTRKNKTLLIHAHQCTPWFYAGLSRLLDSKPRLLFEEHGRHYPEVENKKRALFNKFLIQSLTHRITAVSEDVKKRLVKYEGLSRNRIEVVYNGTSPESPFSGQERLQLRSELGLAPEDFVIGTVGRFDPIKNLPMLLNSLAQAQKSKQEIKGLLIGDGPIFHEIQVLRETLGLTESVVMPGYRADAKRVIQCMDIFVLSSFSEGTSMALLEAMAAGVPAVVTKVGGNPEIVVNGETGWHVHSGAVAEMAETFLTAAQNPEKVRLYGDAAKKRFNEHFTFNAMVQQYRVIYQELLGES